MPKTAITPIRDTYATTIAENTGLKALSLDVPQAPSIVAATKGPKNTHELSGDGYTLTMAPKPYAQGGFATVRFATMTHNDDAPLFVLVKKPSIKRTMQPEGAPPLSKPEAIAEAMQSMQHEYDFAANLPLATRAQWLFKTEKKGYLVMAPLSESLDAFHIQLTEQNLNSTFACYAAPQLLRQLASMHGIKKAHRDIKPENILLRDGRVELADFGLGCQGIAPKTSTYFYGTRAYGAPELLCPAAKAKKAALDKADLFSLGLTLLLVAAGHEGNAVLECLNEITAEDFENPSENYATMFARAYNGESVVYYSPEAQKDVAFSDALNACYAAITHKPLKKLLRDLTHPNPSKRPNAEQACDAAQALAKSLPSADESALLQLMESTDESAAEKHAATVDW